MKKILLFFVLSLAVPLSLVGGSSVKESDVQADLEFEKILSEIFENEPFSVKVKYQTNLPERNERFVAILRLKAADNISRFKEFVLDNNGEGYDSPEGTLVFECQVDGKFSKELYLEAYLVPFSMNDLILAMIQTYPTDGTHGFEWKGGTTGHTRDIYYLDRLLAGKQKGGSTYCCGLTFEVFLRAYQEYNKLIGKEQIGDISFSEMKSARWEWYGSQGDTKRQMVAVLEKKGLGVVLKDKTRARPGDFCMFWRYNDTGHSVIFIDWIKDSTGKITSLKYWSAQRVTNGIGYRVETVGFPGGIDLDQTYIARLKKPRDKLDRENLLISVQHMSPLKVK